MLAFAFKLYYGFVRRLGSVFKQIFGLRGVFKTAFRQNHHLRIAAIVTFKQDCVWKGTAVSARKTIGALNGMLFVCLVKSSLLKGIAVNTRKYAGKLKTVATITSLSLSFAFAYIFAFTPAQSYAATNNTLNFQARLENASGSIAPDGNYNVSFHLFNASSSSGSTDTGCGTDSNCLWSEQYTYNSGAGSSDVRIHVANGYLSVNLGSNTAFPGTINWAQNLYLTMDIGGTSGSSVTWDGQMSPRIQLTGVPYAFQAYSASQLQELQGTYTDTLQFMTDTTQANTITLPDLGGSFGLLALQSSSPGTQQTGNFNISGTGLLNTLDATGSGTANTLTIGAANASTTGGGINLGTNVTTGAVTIGGTGTTGAITLGQTSTGNNTINIGASAGNTYTQTINIGTSTTNGSTSNVNIGPGTSGTATGTTTIAQNAVIGSKAGTTLTVGQNNVPNAKLNVNTGSTVAFRAYQAGTYDVGQFAETGTGVGTVTTNGTTTVTGSSTQFTQYFQVGDVIQIGSVLATVTAISSDTSLTTSVSFGSASGQTYYRGVVGAGTVTTYGTTAIVGSGTSFTTTFQPGDSIMINGESNIGTIASITDNTHLTLYSAAATSASGLSYARYGYDRLDIKANGNVGIGTNNSSAALMIQPTGVGQTGLLLQAANGQTATTALVNVTDSSSNGSNTLLGVNVNSSSSGGTVNVGYTGSSAVSSTANIGTGYGAAQTVNIGNGAISSGNTNVNIGNGSVTGTGAEVVAIGTTSGSNSTTTINGGSGASAISVQAASTGTINIGNAAVANTVDIGAVSNDEATTVNVNTKTGGSAAKLTNIGSTDGSSATNVYAGSGNILLETNNGSGGTTVKSITSNSTTAFQVQNSNSTNALTVDTTTTNLITNPSFESGLTGWTHTGTGSGDSQNTTASLSYDGPDSLQVTSGTTANGGAQVTGFTAAPSGAGTWTLSFYAEAQTIANSFADLAVTINGMTLSTGCTLNSNKVSVNGFQRYWCTFTASSGTMTSINIGESGTTSHVFYVDAVQLTNTTGQVGYGAGNVQVGGIVNSPVTIASTSNAVNTLNIQNTNGMNIFNVDTSDNNNLLPNPDFESGLAGGSGTGWTGVGGSTTLTRDATQSYSGTAAAQVAISTATTGGLKYNLNPVLTAASTTYTVSWYSLLISGTAPTFQVTYSPDGSATNTCTVSGQTGPVTGGWERYSCSVSSATTPTTSGYIQIAQTNSNSSTWDVDAVQLEQAGAATDYNSGNFILNGSVISPLTLQNTSNSTTAFQVQNSAGTNLIGVDTTNGIVNIGSVGSSTLASTLNLATSSGAAQTVNIGNGAISSGNTNVNIGNGSVTGTGAEVVAIGTTSGSNSTTTIQGGNGTGAVGIQAASGGIISIGTNATNPVNIGYSVAPTYVNEAHSNGSGVHTLSFTPTNIGDLVILATKGNLNNRIVSVSGGDVTTWHLVTYNDGVLHEEIWEGVATSTTGGATITANYSTSCSVGGSGCEMVAQEFSSTLGASTNWNVTTAGQQTNSASLTLTYPSLTASENGGLYWGYGYTNGTGAAGSTPGFSYWPIPTTTNVVAYDPTMVKGTTYSPTAVANTGTTVTSDAVAAIITATSSSVNIDGATSLEGPVTSPLMVNSGSNLTNAFQVQNASGVSNFNVDTVHNQVSIGSGAVTTTPNYLYLPDISNNASGNAAITGQWQSSNNWGIGSNSNTGDSILHLGIVTSGTNTWSTTQNLNLLVAGTEEVQPTTGNDSATALQVKNADGESVLQTGTLQTVNSITNYIADSEFALGSGSCPLTDWSVVASATCSQNTTASDSYNGGTSLLLNTTATAGDGVTTTHFTTAPPTTSGGYYTVSFYAMQTSGTPLSGLNLTAAATSGAGNPSNTCTIDGQAANTLNASGFERVVCTIGNFTGVSTIATLKIITSGTVTADTTYISDVQLQSAGSSSAGALSAPLVGQLQLRGVVSTPVALQNSANSSTALQVQNSTGSTIFNVNTNNVNINTSTAGVTGVSSSAPTNVTAVLQQSNSTNPLNSQTYTINTGDRAKGDVIIVSIALASSSVGLDPTTPITGGGVSNWVKVNTNVYGGFNGVGATVVMYEGTVTTVGGTTATVKFNTANPNCWVELISQEFTAGLGANTVWGVTASGTATNTDSSTTVPFPTLTSGSTGSGVYYGYSYITQTTRVDPGTTGFHWFGTPLNSNTVGYNTALTPNTSYSPSTLAPSNTYADSIGVILTPTVDNSVGINGATLVSGAASSAAFQVQNANGSADFNVDTANNAVSVLTGNTGDLSPWQYSSDSTGNNSGLGQNVAVTANGYVYDMTGWDANMIDGKVYYGKVMSNGQIEHMGPTTTSAALVMDQGAVVVNGYVYQLGGATNGTGTATVSTVQYAQINPDGTLGTWHTNAAALPTGGNGVAGAAVVAANGYIYVMGGYYNTTMSSAVYYGKVNADGSVSNWTTSANSEPTALRFASAVYVNGNILLMGGTTGSGSSVATTYTASVNATTGANGAFSTTGNGTMPGSVGVAYATASVVNGYVYLVGGATNDAGASPWYSPVNTVYYGQINSAGNIPTWHTSSQTLPQAAMWQGGVTLNGYLYIIGGYYTPGASPGISANIFYASTARLLVNGSLDLVGATGSDLSSGGDQSSGSSGGMLTAGDTNIVGSLQVAGQASFNDGVAINGSLNASAQAIIGNNLTVGGSTFQFTNGLDHTINIAQASSGAGNNLNIAGGAAATGSGNNGGNLVLNGGAGDGSGSTGDVIITTPTYQTASTQNCGVNCTITLANVNSNGAVVVNATALSLSIVLPSPTNTTAGKVVYVTAANGSDDFTLVANQGDGTGIEQDIAMRQNTTATMIWGGTYWTAAGASSSTTLQSAYNNTLTSAGGAELVVSESTNHDGLTIRDSATNPVSGTGNGTLLEVQNASANELFSVNNDVTEYSSDGGAETQGVSGSTFPSSTWALSGNPSVSVSRYTTAGSDIETGQASVAVTTTAHASDGVANTLGSTLTANLQYNVSFTARLASGSSTFSTMNVYYSVNGTLQSVACTTGETIAASVWTKVNCSFIAPSSGETSSNAILILQSDATVRTFYIDNLSVTVAASQNYATDGGVDNAGSFSTNWPGVGVISSRSTTYGEAASDSAQVTTTAPNQGVKNLLSINPLANTLYQITVYASASSSFSAFNVQYSPNNGTTFKSCADYNTQTISSPQSAFTEVTCYIQTDGTAVTTPYVYFTQTDATGRTINVDSFSMTVASNTVANVQIGGGVSGGELTLFTLDSAASAPIAANDESLLGSMYYDTTLGKLQCYESDGWGACGSSPDTIVTLSPEYTNAVMHGPSGGTAGVGTMTSDFCSDTLNINNGTSGQPTICRTNETRNFYKWTSPQATAQTYAIYVTYQLPQTFKAFASGQTSLAGFTDSSNSSVSYKVYDDSTSGLTACGTAVSVATGALSSWQTATATGTADPSTCGFNAGDSILFEIDVTASSNANAYVGNLNFTFSNQ